jgi:hypothetical protein
MITVSVVVMRMVVMTGINIIVAAHVLEQRRTGETCNEGAKKREEYNCLNHDFSISPASC